jgi:pyruvate-ferredoxin/flavodoxin oxidoreductase
MTSETTWKKATIDGNEAVARVAYQCSDVCVIYPITPSSPMGELADQWSNQGDLNAWGDRPSVIEMQSEAGAAGAVHGALQTGALCTTFTASQGLLLMIPNMYKIAGELTPAVFHVAARSLAAQALSIFGDHQDVMATRATGFAQLVSASVQEAQDMALIAHASTLSARIPFLHFFDGFRTSHEINTLDLLGAEQVRAMIPERLIFAHRNRALSPDSPVIRGTAQNPDVYFQAREAANPYYVAVPEIVRSNLETLFTLTGRRYRLFDYHGHPEAERIVVIMGSGAETARETVNHLANRGERVGAVQVRLYRPFCARSLTAALPSSVRRIAVLDRTKEPGACGEPLYLDVVAALAEHNPSPADVRVIGGRYGLSSREFTPAMVKSVLDNLASESPRSHFTVGIDDDVSDSSLTVDEGFDIEPEDTYRAVFLGLGADGTVGANKNTIKILGKRPDTYAQAYFVYDSKKSGSRTVSHLRFGPQPIAASYLIGAAEFVGCHQFDFLWQTDVLSRIRHGGSLLLNSAFPAEKIWDNLPRSVQQQIIEKSLRVYAVNAYRIAAKHHLGQRINTIMQTCFFAIANVMPVADAIAEIKTAIDKSYRLKGSDVVSRNQAAVDAALNELAEVIVPDAVSTDRDLPPPVPDHAPEFVRKVTGPIMAGLGERLPVSALPADGTYPTATAAWEKRNIARFVPQWDPETCIQCGQCGFVCPHGVIRAKFFNRSRLEHAPPGFRSAPLNARGFPDTCYSLQVYAEDCTGCALCVDACPSRNTERPGKRAINMHERPRDRELVRSHISFFESVPDNDRANVDFGNVHGVQYLPPLFEFPGACAGCGETPYLRLLSQLFGDRAIIANATGCSSIYGGNLPTTPWSKNKEGRGPAWSNSLFEDNAEFGFGFRLSADQHNRLARQLLSELADDVGRTLANDILAAKQDEEREIRAQRKRVEKLNARLNDVDDPRARRLASVAEHLVRRSIWLVGGDGWAYDIGYGGLDHVLSMDRDVNILVLDTEVYSNTGGQMSKATPMGAVAKFAAGGKGIAKKDLALQAIAYGNVYVARVALGANPQQTLLAFREAERFAGPSLILAYSHCIAHGINMEKGLHQQKLAVDCGHWPLLRYNPTLRESGQNPFLLDSRRPTIPLREYAYNEIRYRILQTTRPEEASRLMDMAQAQVDSHWKTYENMAAHGVASNPYGHTAKDTMLSGDSS